VQKADVEAAIDGRMATTVTTTSASGGRIFASPLARRLAGEAGLDLAALRGSGPHGRIVKADIEAALARGVTAPAAVPSPALTRTEGLPEFELVPHSTMRRIIAERLTESKQQVPHFYLSVDCEIDELLRVRKELNARIDDVKLSVNDFVIKAMAMALIKVPDANASWTEEGLRLYKSADISVAVALDGGLITPIVRSAEAKGLAVISAEVKDLATRARAGKLMPEEYQGGTISVSNLGMYGVRQFDAVINAPQACILAVGQGEQRPVVRDGELAVATVMTCTLSVDHRAVDGALGAQYLRAFKQLIEFPAAMLL
jgi:pyruvate dehydrogenase E2 component (dihydrolipoamide acetyltransferase)